jgi:hypothetical protein
VREFYRTLDVYDGAVQKASKQRTENERFAVYVQSLFGWLTSYIHDDEESIKGCEMDRPAANHWLTSYIHDDEESIKGCEMDRPAANQALGAVAGLLHRLAHDHAATSV